MVDVIVALVVFAIIFIAITAGAWAFAIIMGLIAVVMFMPTPDGIFYTFIFENVKFLFAKKKYTKKSTNAKEKVDAIIDLKEIKDNPMDTRFFKISLGTRKGEGANNSGFIDLKTASRCKTSSHCNAVSGMSKTSEMY